jgi:hypothetical protein
LIVYRSFNSHVFHKLEQVLTEANQILIENDIIPELDIEARNKKLQINKRSKRREKSDPRERAFSASDQNSAGDAGSSQQLLAMMQNLMHGALTQASAAGRSAAEYDGGWAAGRNGRQREIDVPAGRYSIEPRVENC